MNKTNVVFCIGSSIQLDTWVSKWLDDIENHVAKYICVNGEEVVGAGEFQICNNKVDFPAGFSNKNIFLISVNAS